MSSLVLAVVQHDPHVDPSATLAALDAARRVLLRPPGSNGPSPPGVEVVIAEPVDRDAAAALVRRRVGAEPIVVLEAGEEMSRELRAALAGGVGAAPGAYRVRRVVRFLGRDVAAGTVALAWRGEAPAGAAAALPGLLITPAPEIATLIARFDAEATRLAATRSTVGARDFLTGPIAALARRLLARRRDGVPGFILSVLETYAEVLTAAKVWERAQTGVRRHPLPAQWVPPGFTPVEIRTGWLVVRSGSSERLLRALREATTESVEGEPLARGGRGATWSLALGDGTRAVLRWYRRGGALRHFVRDRYFGWQARPWLELALIEEARRRGVPVVEVLAARVDRLRGGFYRGAIVTREVGNSETLAELLVRCGRGPERTAALCAVGRALRRLHDCGVQHRDLNASNILLRAEGDTTAVYLIDFDRARLRSVVSPRARRRALARLARSLAKLAAAGVAVDAREWADLERAYREAA
jgi:3-deoxy-D-manno-octulosonic acid kinase